MAVDGLTAGAGEVMAAVHADIAARLSAAAGVPVTPAEGGFRVGETDTHYLDVHRMFFNWRLCTTPKAAPQTYDRHWCYEGTSVFACLRAVLAAVAWDGDQDTEPEGWIKNGQTGELRQPEPAAEPAG